MADVMQWMDRLCGCRRVVVDPRHAELHHFIYTLPESFRRGEGVVIHKGRNELRRFVCGGNAYVVKSFHKPHLINRFVYGILRPSKAKRSFDHARKLVSMNVGTPAPVGYMTRRRFGLFDESYYVCAASSCRFTYEDLFRQPFDYAEEVLRAVGRVTAVLHERGYAHKDYGRGNILFQKTDAGVRIELVDLNRMHVGKIGLRAGCKNFERLPATPQMHRWMADEYARARGFDAEECYRLMAAYRKVQPGKIDNLY